MQPYHQIIQEKFGIDGNGGIVMKDSARRSAVAAKITGVASGNVTCHCPDRRPTQL
jgi:hypothetical protein